MISSSRTITSLFLALSATIGCGKSAPLSLDFDTPGDGGGPRIAGGHLALLPGQIAPLTFSSAAPFVWYAEHPGVATVSTTGVVTAVGPGRASIGAGLLPPYSYSDWTFIWVYSARCAPSHAPGSLALGDTVRGSLALTDCGLILDDARKDHGGAIGWRMTVDSTRTVRIDLLQDWYCAGIILTDTLMTRIGEPFDQCDGQHRTWTGTLAAGTYIVWGRTFDVPWVGAYSLTARVAAP